MKQIVLNGEKSRIIRVALNEYCKSLEETFTDSKTPEGVKECLGAYISQIDEIKSYFLNQYEIIVKP